MRTLLLVLLASVAISGSYAQPARVKALVVANVDSTHLAIIGMIDGPTSNHVKLVHIGLDPAVLISNSDAQVGVFLRHSLTPNKALTDFIFLDRGVVDEPAVSRAVPVEVTASSQLDLSVRNFCTPAGTTTISITVPVACTLDFSTVSAGLAQYGLSPATGVTLSVIGPDGRSHIYGDGDISVSALAGETYTATAVVTKAGDLLLAVYAD